MDDHERATVRTTTASGPHADNNLARLVGHSDPNIEQATVRSKPALALGPALGRERLEGGRPRRRQRRGFRVALGEVALAGHDANALRYERTCRRWLSAR